MGFTYKTIEYNYKINAKLLTTKHLNYYCSFILFKVCLVLFNERFVLKTGFRKGFISYTFESSTEITHICCRAHLGLYATLTQCMLKRILGCKKIKCLKVASQQTPFLHLDEYGSLLFLSLFAGQTKTILQNLSSPFENIFIQMLLDVILEGKC